MTNDDNNNNSQLLLQQLASILGSTGIAAGAFGAHALKQTLSQKPGAMDNWRTAVSYQLFNAVALLALSSSGKAPSSNSSGKLIAVGTVLFSGSIYGLCLGVGPKAVLGPTTPLGGLLMIGGWVMIGFGQSGATKEL
mmetsp:Transcript_38945/g.47459  ORF Transcript_38945/g.47459 Transcript_38945/m.47459 type:complete len:137 (-) Transcript_38945:111-521(-)|eukprot:CAMPEP_0172513340 /NCGR_PEP_ID=MMETSP1066-20121228/251804_1 /TAXON_ID=671091 /ORGANISM="Coscinodiscus wailesii, Strain CCMP2513" /LENGTH=136 /DNA_ID=CAMNT_0013293555 /DNA_START=101 /DNA_END=511 /DNA_ORIENTATION=+